MMRFDEVQTSYKCEEIFSNEPFPGNTNVQLSEQNNLDELASYFAANVHHPMVLSSAVITLAKVMIFMISYVFSSVSNMFRSYLINLLLLDCCVCIVLTRHRFTW